MSITRAEKKVRAKLAEFDDPLKSLDCVLDDALYSLKEERKKTNSMMVALYNLLTDGSKTDLELADVAGEIKILRSRAEELAGHVSNMRNEITDHRIDHQRSYDEVEYLQSIIRIAVGMISTTEYWRGKHPEECHNWLMSQLTRKNDGHEIYPNGWHQETVRNTTGVWQQVRPRNGSDG